MAPQPAQIACLEAARPAFRGEAALVVKGSGLLSKGVAQWRSDRTAAEGTAKEAAGTGARTASRTARAAVTTASRPPRRST